MAVLSYLASIPKYLLCIPGESGYSSRTTATQVAQDSADSIKGKVYIITGANTGLGKETARVLTDFGGRVFMACRSTERMTEARADLLKLNPKAEIDMLKMDISSLRSIEAGVEAFKRLKLPLHCLINNAGVMLTPPSTTADGAEMQFGTNVLGHYHLSTLLLPLLKESGTVECPSRIVHLSSMGHIQTYSGGIRFDNLGLEGYDSGKAYGQSKLGNLLMARFMAMDLEAEGAKNVFTAAVHPGVISTELSRHIPQILRTYVLPLMRPIQKSIPQGSATTVYLATSPVTKLKAGAYYADGNLCFTSAEGSSDEMAQRLKRVLEEMVKDPARTNFA